MAKTHKLIHEVHRRSLWQVLSIYLVGSWVVLQVVETLTESAGLPDWVPPFAVVLLLLGLPVVMATAFIQEGVSHRGESHSVGSNDIETRPDASATATLDSSAAPADSDLFDRIFANGVFTWRNAIVGGGLSFTLLGVAVAGYFVMRETGIGPVASLAAQGVFDDREALVLADFENTTGDATLAAVVTEALRVDLTQSTVITLLSPASVVEALTLMDRDPSEPVGGDLAREIAVRRGLKAAVIGEVGAAGSGYVLTASIVEANTGEVLAPFRVTAANEDEVLDAIEKLSEKIREKAGESLRMIRAGDALASVTTTSLEALRKFVEAGNLTDEGHYARAIGLLEDAIELDPDFAMAYRQLSVTLQSAGEPLSRQIAASTRAYELRDHLTEIERNVAVAYYHRVVTGETAEVIQAYENVLAVDPDHPAGLNNLGIAYSELGHTEAALELIERAAYGPGRSGASWVNLVQYRTQLEDFEGARNALDTMSLYYPDRVGWDDLDHWGLESHMGNHAAAHAIAESLSTAPGLGLGWNSGGVDLMAASDVARGMQDEALAHLENGVATFSEAGRPSNALQLLGRQIGVQRALARDPAAARGLLRTVLESGFYEAVPAEARDPVGLLEDAAMLGDGNFAQEILDRTEADIEADPALRSVFSDRYMRRARALTTAAQGDPGEGARVLEQLSREMDCRRCDSDVRAVLHLAAGDTARAMVALSELVDGPIDLMSGPVSRVLAQEALGDLYYAQGDPTAAAPYYAAFAETWADADPSLQPRVQRALERSGN